MSKPKRVSVLISGRGSNLRALMERQSGFEVSHVVSDQSAADGLHIAREAGIPVSIVTRNKFPSSRHFKSELLSVVRSGEPDLVALAGFMVILPPDFIASFHGRLLNIHPSLLPNLPGLDTHQRALDAGYTQHGCTVHFVDAGIDTGPLIAQSTVAIIEGDTADSLAARVIKREHELYPAIVSLVAAGDINLKGRRVNYSARAVTEAERIGCSLVL